MAKLLRHFLDDENGPVASVEMECLMAKVGSGDVLQDVISGLLLVIPKQGIQGFIKCKVMKT